MKIITTCFFICLLATTTLNAQKFEWARSFGGTGWDQGKSITVDNSGNIYTTGDFGATADFDPGIDTANLTSAGNNDVFVQKMDASGNFLWTKSFRGNEYDYGYSICTDASGNIYTTGSFGGYTDFDPGAGVYGLYAVAFDNIFIQKMDSAGNFIWAKSFGNINSNMGHSITVDTSGNVYTTGYYMGTVDFDPGSGTTYLSAGSNYAAFVLKMNASGNFIWAKSFGGTGSSTYVRGCSLTVDASGNVYTSGYVWGTADFDPGSGVYNLTSAGNNDIFIQKMDASGNFLWAKSFGSNEEYEVGYSIGTDADGNVYTTGGFNGTVDFDPGPGVYSLTPAGHGDIFVQKMDALGNFLWAKSFGGISDDHGNSIKIDASGNVFTTGIFYGTADFDPGPCVYSLTSAGSYGVFVQKMDSAGNFLWAKSFSGAGTDEGFSITVDASGNIYTTGYFYNTVDFDPGTGTCNLSSAGWSDIYVQKMIPCFITTGTDEITACNNFTWIDGTTYTSSNNTATYTLNNGMGCDSVVTLNLTINNSNTSIDSITACNSYTWIDGNTYTSSNNTATYTLPNAAGCDSVVSLKLTINNSSTYTDLQTACDSYTWIDGNTYTSSNNTATFILTNAAGCDSVITIDLTINSVSDTTTSLNDVTITANNINATYQWLDCNYFFVPVAGNIQSYTATQNGSYAVVLTENGCVDTSACVEITNVGIVENNFGDKFMASPIPTHGDFSIDLGDVYSNTIVSVFDANGKLIETESFSQSQFLNMTISAPAGVYHVRVYSGDKEAAVTLVKE